MPISKKQYLQAKSIVDKYLKQENAKKLKVIPTFSKDDQIINVMSDENVYAFNPKLYRFLQNIRNDYIRSQDVNSPDFPIEPTLEYFIGYTKENLLQWRNIGTKTVNDLCSILDKAGIKLETK